MGPAGLYFAGDQTAGFAAAYGQIGAALAPYHLAPAALAPASEPGAALTVNDHFPTRDDTPLLAKVTVPTLIINGKQDGVIPPAAAEAANAAIKGSQLVELDDCGHFPFFEQPEKTTEAILVFVRGRRADTVPVSRNSVVAIGSFSDMPLPSKTDVKAARGKTIIARWDVDEKGKASRITLDPPSGSRDIDRAIIEAVNHFRFQPATRDGLPITAHLTHTFTLTP